MCFQKIFSFSAPIISSTEAERLIENSKVSNIVECQGKNIFFSPTPNKTEKTNADGWSNMHIFTIKFSSTSKVMEDHNYVLEAMNMFDKVEVLIHELVSELWSKKVSPSKRSSSSVEWIFTRLCCIIKQFWLIYWSHSASWLRCRIGGWCDFGPGWFLRSTGRIPQQSPSKWWQ